LEKQDPNIKAYFPPDGNTTLAVLEKSLNATNGINVIVAGKTLEPRWLTPELAKKAVNEGLLVWDFASDVNPDIVLAGIGDYVTKEAIAALDLIKTDLPDIRVRFVNVVDLTALQTCHFENYFTADKPVIINYHGYPQTLKKLLFDRSDTERLSIHGYIENGSTTTPFDMHVRNRTSKYHLAMEAYTKLAASGLITSQLCKSLHTFYNRKLKEHRLYIREHGVDPKEIEEWKWQPKS
jgi:xylulose-5-phosphate/fructose-6-phosphate phosphoketolase